MIIVMVDPGVSESWVFAMGIPYHLQHQCMAMMKPYENPLDLGVPYFQANPAVEFTSLMPRAREWAVVDQCSE